MPQFDLTKYATVAERLQLFWAKYPKGRINTQVGIRDDGSAFCQAFVYGELADPFPTSTGHALEALTGNRKLDEFQIERGETSAVGRALALMGFASDKSIASREEMEKVERVTHEEARKPIPKPTSGVPEDSIKVVERMCRDLISADPEKRNDLDLKFVELGVVDTGASLRGILRSIPTPQAMQTLVQWLQSELIEDIPEDGDDDGDELPF